MEIHFQTDKKLIVVDCRELFPPEPMEKVLEAVHAMQEDEAVLMVHRKEPFHLYERLDERGCDYEVKKFDDGGAAFYSGPKDKLFAIKVDKDN